MSEKYEVIINKYRLLDGLFSGKSLNCFFEYKEE